MIKNEIICETSPYAICLLNLRITTYVSLSQLHEPPFSNAEYELVVLHPDHFLPAGSTINMHTEDPDDYDGPLG